MQHPHFLLRNPTCIFGNKSPYCTKIRHYGSTAHTHTHTHTHLLVLVGGDSHELRLLKDVCAERLAVGLLELPQLCLIPGLHYVYSGLVLVHIVQY